MLQSLKAHLVGLFRRPFSPQRFFLIVAAPLGFILVFLVPPFQAPDEHTHFFKEVYLSRGGVIAHVQPYRIGADLPAKYKQTAAHYKDMYLDSEKKLDVKTFKNDLQHPSNDNRPSMTAFENTAQYPPLAYAPQAAAISVTNVFSGSVLAQMYAARLATLVCWLALVFFAIRKLPFGKWGAVALTLTPLSIFLSISSSNDAITFGLSLMFISYVLATIVNKGRLRKNEGVGLVLLGAALGLCKPPYLMLTALALAIPIKRFKQTKDYFKFLAALFGATLLAIGLWQLIAHSIQLNFYPGSDTSGQLHYVLQHPVSSAIMILKTLIIYPIGDDLVLQLIGLKAWMVAQTPFWIIMLDYVVIVLAVLYAPIAKKNLPQVSSLARGLSGALIVGGVLAVSLLLYITYTPVGMNTIVGLQGRYFIPFTYLLIPLIGGSAYAVLKLERGAFGVLQLLIVGIALSVLPLTISRYFAL